MDEWQECVNRLDQILGKDTRRNWANLMKIKEYLLDNLTIPMRITGIEDFPWEERYVVGRFPDKEYNKMKKNNPSYTDEFDLLDILDPNEYDDCMARILRITDKKEISYGLSWFKGIEVTSESCKLLDIYSKWHCNYDSTKDKREFKCTIILKTNGQEKEQH